MMQLQRFFFAETPQTAERRFSLMMLLLLLHSTETCYCVYRLLIIIYCLAFLWFYLLLIFWSFPHSQAHLPLGSFLCFNFNFFCFLKFKTHAVSCNSCVCKIVSLECAPECAIPDILSVVLLCADLAIGTCFYFYFSLVSSFLITLMSGPSSCLLFQFQDVPALCFGK